MRALFYKKFSVFILIAALATQYSILLGEGSLARSGQSVRTIQVTQLAFDEIRNLGWKSEALDAIFDHAAGLSSDSLMIVTGGRIVASFGDLSRPFKVHSIRKSLLSALIGRHLGSGVNQIQLDATLQELGIDDSPQPLTKLQKTATVRHLLKSVSGINHPAAASGGLQAEIDRRLGYQENEPGKLWAYNNWDYNALTTIFERKTGFGIAEAFEAGFAQPLGLEDFDISAVSYLSDTKLSVHSAAGFTMSARDLASLGQLYLKKGRSGEEQILPERWIDLIAEDFTKTGKDDLRWGHGYLWWLPSKSTGLPQGTFWAWGLGNQALIVIPAWDTVIVHQSDTTEFLKRFLKKVGQNGTNGEGAVEQLILACRAPSTRESEYCLEHRFITRGEFDRLLSLIVAARS